MASNNNNRQPTRGYANVSLPSRNETSFQDDLSTLTSMIQRSAETQRGNFQGRGSSESAPIDPHEQPRRIPPMQPQRGAILNHLHSEHQFQRGETGRQGDDYWNQNQVVLPPPPSMNAPRQEQFTHHCSICNVSCNHEVAYRQHLSGKKHQKKAAQFAVATGDGTLTHYLQVGVNAGAHSLMPNGLFDRSSLAQPIPPKSNNDGRSNDGGIMKEQAVGEIISTNSLNQKTDSTHEQYFCSACNVTCNHELAYRQHLEGKRHKKQVARAGVFGSMMSSVQQSPQQLVPAPVIEVSDPRIKPSSSSQVAEQQSIADVAVATTDPVSSPDLPEKELAAGYDEDSEEEGEIDEAKEDIEQLYNDFEEPVSASCEQSTDASQTDEACDEANVESHVDSDIDEMFGEDNHVESVNETEADSDIDEMFGDDDRVVGASTPTFGTTCTENGHISMTANHSPVSRENDADEDEMFGKSSDEEEGEVNSQAPIEVLNGCASSSSLVKEIDNTIILEPSSGLSRTNQDADDDENDVNRKRVSFSIHPPLSENNATPKIPVTASEALAAARRRTSIPRNDNPVQGVQIKSLLKNTTGSLPLSSTQIQTKPKSLLKKATQPSKLQKISTSNTSLSTGKQPMAEDTKRTYYHQLHPDKLMSSLRSWDFVRELNDSMKKGQRQQSKKNDQDTLKKGKKRPLEEADEKSLPDSFDSVSHYKALWAPLLIEEAKAQLLSEVVSAQSSSSTTWVKRSQLVMGIVAKVEVSLSAKDLSYESGHGHELKTTPIEPTVVLHIRPITRGASIGCAVAPNDLLLFVREASIVELTLRGLAFNHDEGAQNDSLLGVGNLSKGRLGFVGHALNHRSRSVDGLLARASQQLWSQFSSLDEMFVIRIGSNITALREFEALSRLDQIPLSNFLLDGRTEAIVTSDVYRGINNTSSTNFDPLSQSGLPVGFRIYVKSKMNASQLHAITASAKEYGSGGFTLIKGPPGTGKSTTLVSILNALHLRQYQEYYESIERIVTESDASTYYEELALLNKANEVKPRILVCAPSNAAIDNVVAKIMSDRFVDGNGSKYSPSIIRVGSGIVNDIAKKVSLQGNVNSIIQQGADLLNLESLINETRKELKRLVREIQKIKVRIQAVVDASPYDISDDWEIRILEEQNDAFRILFVNHRSKTTTFDIPPKVRPTEKTCQIKQLPHYVALLKSLTKYTERHNLESSTAEKYIILQNHASMQRGRDKGEDTSSSLIQELETHCLNAAHIVLTTLGSAGSRAIASAKKFEVIVIDEAAQSSEMSTLLALQLGSSHAILVGDPQQLPATIFSMSGRSSKYDRSLFQRLEQCNHPVVMLNTQYRMNPMISEFPRHIFYKGMLLDGPNTQDVNFGGDLKVQLSKAFPNFKPVTILDLDSREEREGTGLSNIHEAQLVLHLYLSLDRESNGVLADRVAIITPYAQQTVLLHKLFEDAFGSSYCKRVEISTVDSFQGREAAIVIFSCVRAAGGKGSGIGFLSDVQRMNVALTRAKHFLFIVARRRSIMANHYWRQLVEFARERNSLIHVPIDHRLRGMKETNPFPELTQLAPDKADDHGYSGESDYSA